MAQRYNIPVIRTSAGQNSVQVTFLLTFEIELPNCFGFDCSGFFTTDINGNETDFSTI